MENKTYDRLKFFSLVILPAAATLYLALADTWGLSYAPQIAGTITAFDTFLGTVLGISSKHYHEGNE